MIKVNEEVKAEFLKKADAIGRCIIYFKQTMVLAVI